MSEILDEILGRIPLKTRLKVLNEMMLMDFLTEFGFREDKQWIEEEEEMLTKLLNYAKKITKSQLSEIEDWELDGKPK